MDGRTDVGHINLIGGLVTRNPPKNDLRLPYSGLKAKTKLKTKFCFRPFMSPICLSTTHLTVHKCYVALLCGILCYKSNHNLHCIFVSSTPD